MTGLDPALVDRVRDRLADLPTRSGDPQTSAQDVATALQRDGVLLGDAAVLQVVDALRLDATGAGPLQALLTEPGVTDVLVNAPDEVYVDSGDGLRRTAVRFPHEAAVRRLAQRLAASAGRRLDDAAPFVDVRLRDGTRLHAVLAPVARRGTCLSLRIPASTPLSLDDLRAAGTLHPAGHALLRDLVVCRVPFVVSGGTGSGKTTLLAALLAEVDPDHRIVVVEDSHELTPDHPHVVSLEGRPANVEGSGEITLRALVRQALRMRPDRLVVGEVRGAEVTDLLAAMNTGHEGSCATVHANAAADVPARFEALAVAAGLSREAVHAQLASAVDVVAHLVRGVEGRRLAEIAVLVRLASGLVVTESAVTFPNRGEPVVGAGADRLEALLDSSTRR